MSNLPQHPGETSAVASARPIGRFSLDALASVLASAGLGLLVWMGVSLALLQVRSDALSSLRNLQYTGLILGMALAATGVINLRACPAATGVKWRQRSSAVLVLTLACALATLLLLIVPAWLPGWTALTAALLAIGSICTLLSLGMGRSEGAHPGWQRSLVAPNFLAYALLAGIGLLFALIALKWPEQRLLFAPAPSLLTLVLIVAASKTVYWRENGGLRVPVAGLQPSWALPLRATVLVLLAVVPALLIGAMLLWPQLMPRAGWCLVALSVLAGGYLERQLLSAEALSAGDTGRPGLSPISHKPEQ